MHVSNPLQFFGDIWRGNLSLIVLLFCGTPDTSATCFGFGLPFLLLAVVSTLIEFEGEWHEKLKLEYLHFSFHFGYFAIVCFNRSLRESSILFEVFLTGHVKSKECQRSGHSVNTLLCLKPVVMESNGLVKAVPTHTDRHLTRSGRGGGQKWSALWWICHNEGM